MSPVGGEQGSPVRDGVLIKACETWHNTCCLVRYKDACSLSIQVSVWCLLFMSACHSKFMNKGLLRGSWGPLRVNSAFSSSFLVPASHFPSFLFLIGTCETVLSASITQKSPNFLTVYPSKHFSSSKIKTITPQNADTWNQHCSRRAEEPSIIDLLTCNLGWWVYTCLISGQKKMILRPNMSARAKLGCCSCRGERNYCSPLSVIHRMIFVSFLLRVTWNWTSE